MIAGGWPPFLVHAVVAGVMIAAASGLVGYFLVLRAQVFTGDALSHVAVTGAFAALAAGIDLRIGLFVATVAVAVGLGALGGAGGGRGRGDDVVIGAVFAWILGLGVFFLTLYTTTSTAATTNGNAGATVLFGSIFGLSTTDTVTAAALAAGIIVGVLLIARPLLFASLDPAVAAARGVPVTALGVGFLALVGATAAEASQAVGALLLLGLLTAPAATAHRLTPRPYPALALSAGLAAGEMLVGLAVSVLLPRVPPSFAIIAVATLVYGAAHALTHHRAHPRRRPPPGHPTRPISHRPPAPRTDNSFPTAAPSRQAPR